jgi:hypothetical protein
MQAVGPTHLILLLVAVAALSAAAGFLGSLVMQRKKRRARGYFVLGFLCGVTATAILRVRRRSLHVLGAIGQRVSIRPAETRGGAYRFAARALSLAATVVEASGRSDLRGCRNPYRRLPR